MQTVPDTLFKSLADPTRRALFERLSRDGEQTVRMLTDNAGVSQPAVSKHLRILKHAGLVRQAPWPPNPLQRSTTRSCPAGPLDEPLQPLLARPI